MKVDYFFSVVHKDYIMMRYEYGGVYKAFRYNYIDGKITWLREHHCVPFSLGVLVQRYDYWAVEKPTYFAKLHLRQALKNDLERISNG